MAFDMPIDADRVDDLGLFSFFLRAPIVGTLMWILGGHEAKKQQEEEEKTRQKDDENYLKNARPPPAQLQKMIESNQQKRRGIMKKTPRLVGSDISDFGDCAIQLNAAEMEHHFAFSTPKDDYDLKKNNKRMSWSDESGQDLVQYIGNDTSTLHDTQHSSNARLVTASSIIPTLPMPVKAAIKRTSTPRNDLAMTTDTSRFLPKGLNGGHGGLLIPTKPYGDGYVSPDWGWYINTTPPTPEIYHASSKQYMKKPTNYSAQQEVTRRGPSALDSPAFSKGHKGGTAHWPGVPI